MNHTIQIRMATPDDAERLLEIYTPYIVKTPITFEYDVPSKEEFAQRIRTILEKYPYLVALDDGKIVGYAYASSYRVRAAFQWCVETSIYVDMESQGNRIGTKLYGRLIELLKKQNVRNVYACVTMPNEKSQRIHENFHFSYIGMFHNAGYKFDSWYDIGWFELQLESSQVSPLPVIPIKNVL